MSTKKATVVTRPCRIFQWLENQYPEFAAAIRDLCLEGALSPGGRARGVTFLCPPEEVRAKITADAYTDAADDAAATVEKLIIPLALTSADDFKQHENEIGSSRANNGAGLTYKVKKIEKDEIVLEKSAKLKRAADFQPRERRKSEIAVWMLSGSLPEGTPGYKPPAAPPKPPKAIHGGGCCAPPGRRESLAREVEDRFAVAALDRSLRTYDPYLAKVVTLLAYLKRNHPEYYAIAAAVMDYDPAVTFYLLLEPYRSPDRSPDREYLIPDRVLFGIGCWNGAEFFGDAGKEYRAFFADQETRGAVGDHKAYEAQVDQCRQAMSQNMRQAQESVTKCYADLRANRLGGLGNIIANAEVRRVVLPRKLWQDEFRYIFAEAFACERADFDPASFEALRVDLCKAWPGDDWEKELVLTNKDRLQCSVKKGEDILFLMRFVYSTNFMYFPGAPPSATADAAKDVSALVGPDMTVYDRASRSFRRLPVDGEMQMFANFKNINPDLLQLLAK